MQASELKKTALHDYHVSQGARLVEFAGWSMPVQYSNLTIIQSTLHTRQHASLFDVSHMLQVRPPSLFCYQHNYLSGWTWSILTIPSIPGIYPQWIE